MIMENSHVIEAAKKILGVDDLSVINKQNDFEIILANRSPENEKVVGSKHDEIITLATELAKPKLSEQKTEALAALDQAHAEILRDLTGNATIEERDTWQAKALAAQAISDGNASAIQTEMIVTEATMSGIEVSDLVTTILTKNGAFMKMIGIAAGHRTATRAAISSAPDISTLGLILEEANSRAEELMSQYLAEINAG